MQRKFPPLPDELEEMVKRFRARREPDMPKIIISQWKPEEPELDYIV